MLFDNFSVDSSDFVNKCNGIDSGSVFWNYIDFRYRSIVTFLHYNIYE